MKTATDRIAEHLRVHGADKRYPIRQDLEDVLALMRREDVAEHAHISPYLESLLRLEGLI